MNLRRTQLPRKSRQLTDGRKQWIEEPIYAGESTWRMNWQDKYPTSTPQVQDKYGTSTGQVQDKLNTDNSNIIALIQVVGEQELSVKEMMSGVNLKGRDNFLNLYLTPSMKEGYIRQLYPQSPRHPRQKYLLTVKGLALYNELSIWNTSNRGAKVKPWQITTSWKWKKLMAEYIWNYYINRN